MHSLQVLGRLRKFSFSLWREIVNFVFFEIFLEFREIYDFIFAKFRKSQINFVKISCFARFLKCCFTATLCATLGMRHVTSCPGLVVSQECEEVGLEATGGEYCRQFSQQLTIQHRDNSIPVKIGTWVQGQQIQGLRGGGGWFRVRTDQKQLKDSDPN